MQTATIAQLRKEMQLLSHAELLTVCTRMIKYKKENKELLSYILFESKNEQSFVLEVKQEIQAQFDEVNTASIFWAKKTLRKILRMIVKQAKFSGQPATAIELHIYFCQQLKTLPYPIFESGLVQSMFQNQLKKIQKYILTLHEDLQFDYTQILSQL
jgi:hypothetical protein